MAETDVRQALLDRARDYARKSKINEWHKLQPWKLTREQIEAGEFPGIELTESAAAMGGGGRRLGTIGQDTIKVSPEYFTDLDDDGRASLLYHEAAHFVQAAVTARPDFTRLAEPFRDNANEPLNAQTATWNRGLNATEFPAYLLNEIQTKPDSSWRETELDAPEKVAMYRALMDDSEAVGMPSGRIGDYDRSPGAPTTKYGTPTIKYHEAIPIVGLSPGTKRDPFPEPKAFEKGVAEEIPKRQAAQPPTEDTYRNIAPRSLAAMYRNDGFDDVQGRFLKGEEAATARLMGFYRQARAEIMTFTGGMGDPTPNDVAFYSQITAEVDRQAEELRAGAQEWIDGTIPAAFVEGARTQDPRVGFTVVHDQALQALSQNTLGLIVNTNEGIRRSVQQVVAAGILEGLSSGEMFRRMADGGLQPGPWKSVEERAGVIARTETMRAYNAGNIVGAQSSGAPFVEWITSPDEKVCEICAPRDGKRYRTPHFDPGRLGVTEERAEPGVKLTIPKDAGDPELVAQAQARLDQLTTMFPAVRAPGIQIVDGRIGGVTSDVGDIFLRSGTFDPEKWDQFQIEDAARRARPENDGLGYYADGSPAGIVTHEFGHKVYSQLNAMSMDPEIRPFLDSLIKANKKNPVSIYGQTTGRTGIQAGHEPFAEIFAAAMSGNDPHGLLPFLADKGLMKGEVTVPRPPLPPGLDRFAHTVGVRPFSAAAIETLYNTERDFVRNADYETLVYVNPDTGATVRTVPGGPTSVEVTEEMRAAGVDMILTHNHPRGHDKPPGHPEWAGNSFSPDDIATFLAGQHRAIRAIGPGWMHTLSTPDGRKLPDPNAWLAPLGGVDIFAEQVTPFSLHRDIQDRVRNRFANAINDGTMTIAQANAEHFHAVATEWTEAMRGYGHDITYTREPVPEEWDVTPRKAAPASLEKGVEAPSAALDFDGDRKAADSYGRKTWGEYTTSMSAPSTGIYAEMDPIEVTRLSGYSQEDYFVVNGFLRGTDTPGTFKRDVKAKAQPRIEAIDTALKRKPIPEDTISYRTSFGLPFGLDRETAQAGEIVGRSFVDPGFYSTSLGGPSPGWASKPVHYRIKVPKGTAAAYIAPVSNSEMENELLLDRGLEFRVTGYRKTRKLAGGEGGEPIVEVDLEVIPGSGANSGRR